MTKDQFARLVLDSTDSLYRVSKGILKNDSDCEDAVWEAIGIGFAKLDTLRDDRFAKTWLTRILIHQCYKVLRERAYRADLSQEELEGWAAQAQNGRPVFPGRSGAAGTQEQSRECCELYEALTGLDEKYRVPIVLFYLEGYSVREIADILQSTEGTVKSWLHRGRGYLKEMLKED